MKSRWRVAIVVAAMAFGIAACGGSSYNKGNTPTKPASGVATTVQASGY